MPNIFDGINKLSDNELIEQIALLETINMYNLSKPIAQKAIKKAVNIINFLGNKIGKDPNIKEPEVKEIWTLLEEKTNELKEYTREELNERLKDILIEKSRNKDDEPSEDAISVQVIEEAAKLCKINDNLTPANKADMIYLNYSKKNKENEENYSKEKNIQEVEYVILDEENNPGLECAEENEFKKVIEADKITILNAIKNLDKDMLAKIVWMAVENYGELFTPKNEEMPNYVNGEEKEAILKNDEVFKALKENLIKLENEVKVCIDNIEKNDIALNKENKSLNSKIRIIKNSEKDIIDLENLKSSLEEEKKLKCEKLQIFEEQRKNLSLEELNLLMEEYEKVKLEVFDKTNEINNIIHEITYKNELRDNTLEEIKEKEELLKKLSTQKEKLIKEKEKLQDVYLSKKEEVKQIESEKRHNIFSRWKDTFDRFIVEDTDIENIVDFSIDELIEIEKCLYELHFTDDPEALSIGLVKEGREKYDYFEAVSDEGFNFEVWYKVLENKKIHIIAIHC